MLVVSVQTWWWMAWAGVGVAATVGPRSPFATEGGGKTKTCEGGVSDAALLQELRTITDLVLRMQTPAASSQPVSLPPPLVNDCSTLRQAGVKGSGVYRLPPFTFGVYCDMTTEGGGWTVIQRRLPQEDEVDFARGWKEYRDGFGELEGEVWLGLEALHQLTHSGPHRYQLRVDMIDYKLGPKHALYQDFRVGPESDGYRLQLSNYSGDAGDALSRFHSGRRFSTYDRDQDLARNRSCAGEKEGGWWFHACYAAHLNGRHPATPPRRSSSSTEIRWWSSREHVLVLTHVEMKLRRHLHPHEDDDSEDDSGLEDDYEDEVYHDFEDVVELNYGGGDDQEGQGNYGIIGN